MASPKAPIEPAAPLPPAAWQWIKTDCGRAKYGELASRRGPLARVRLAWFVLIAALRDWRLPGEPAVRRPPAAGGSA